MIRETYKGRQLKAVKGKSYANSRISVNGTDCGEWFGTQADVIEWAKRTIDDVDSRPFEGRWVECWYAPGTYELNEHGHIVAPGGICSCNYCKERRIQPCADITVCGVCVCDHCMKPYLAAPAETSAEEVGTESQSEAEVPPLAPSQLVADEDFQGFLAETRSAATGAFINGRIALVDAVSITRAVDKARATSRR